MSMVKDGLAKAWADQLQTSSGIASFPHRHDALTAPPFMVVVVKRLRPLMLAEDVHEAEVRVVVVTDSADSNSARHRQLVGAAYAAIQATPRYATDPVNLVRLCGFVIEDIEQVSGAGDDGKKIYSDVFMIRAGVAGVAGP